MPSRLRAVRREVAIFLLFLALAVVLTWPLALNLRTAVPDQGDPLLTTWIIDWVGYALTHSPMSLYQAPIYYPARLVLAYSENLIGIALVALPFRLLGFAPLTIYNIVKLIGFAHAAYGGFVLARVVLGIRARRNGTPDSSDGMSAMTIGALVAGIFFGFLSFKFDHLSHVQIIWSGWLPLLLAAVIAFWDKPTNARAVALAAAFFINGLTNIHFLLFGSVALVATVIVLTMARPTLDRRYWTRLVVALGVGGLLLLPVLIPYRMVAELYGMKRVPAEVLDGSGRWDDWLRVTGRSWLYSKVGDPALQRAERLLFPGLLVIFLTGAAALMERRRVATLSALTAPHDAPWLRRLDILIVVALLGSWLGAVAKRLRATVDGDVLFSLETSALPLTIAIVLIITRLFIRFPDALGGAEGRSLRTALQSSRFPAPDWAAAVWIAIGVFGSFGLNAFFHRFLFDYVTIFQSIRAPGRWAIIAYAGLAVWAAIGTVVLLERRLGWRRNAVAAVILGVAVLEVIPTIQWEHLVVDPRPVYRWMNYERVGPVVELPIIDGNNAHFQYVLNATIHHVPIMNGTSGFEPPLHQQLRTKYEKRELDGAFLDLLEKNGAAIVVVHGDRIADHGAVLTAWLREAIAADRLAPIRRFDNGVTGDYVFAVKRNVPDWLRLRDPDRDRMGRSVEENVQRFFDGAPTFNLAPFGRLESPTQYERLRGPLTVKGWALAPEGVRHVDVLLDSGTVRIRATPEPRGDVSTAHPYYGATTKPGFSLTIPKRPRGVARETDVQIEIVTNDGRKVRLADTLINWR
jgi:hypothetical protein